VLVIGLNQTIDRTVRLDSLAPGEVLRANDVAVTPGGKAVNVCRAAATLGVPARLVGPFPGELGRFATGLLAAEDLDVAAVPVAGEIRGTTIILERSGRATVINEPGPPLDAADWQRVLDAVSAELPPGSVVAISGSSPPGAPADAHHQLIALVRARGGFVAVDVAGDSLLAAARSGADLLSPNLAEAEAAVTGSTIGNGHRRGEAVEAGGDDTREAVAARAEAAAAELVRAGAGAAVVSAGHHGAAFHAPAGSGFVDAPTVDVVNPIGAGDALLGAMLAAIELGRPLPSAVHAGVAYAAASVAHPTAGYADPALVARLGATT
jgi:1-phosphofructokinase family hexose kinase